MKKLLETRNEALPLRLNRILIGLFAGLLVFCVRPAFGQHSGSGSGHAGGGSVSAGGHGAGTVAASTGAGKSASGSARVSGPGDVPSSSVRSPSHIFAAPGARLEGASSAEGHFASGNVTWVEPPGMQGRGGTAIAASTIQSGAAMNRVRVFTAAAVDGRHGPVAGTFLGRPVLKRNEPSAKGPFLGTTVIVRPPIIHNPRHFRSFKTFFIADGCLSGFFPGVCGSAFWLGPGWGYGANCDPCVDCDGNGYLDEVPAGGNGIEDQSEPKSSEYGPFEWQESLSLNFAGASPEPRVPVVIYLRDGTSYGVVDYWLTAGKLNYLTTYGGESTIPLEMLDLQKTVDQNAARGMEFTLRNQRLLQEQR